MQWHEFIFSSQPKHSRLRHVVFWLLWWAYFYSTVYWLKSPHNNSGLWETTPWEWTSNDVTVSIGMWSIHIIACYVVLWFLLPRYLLKSEYFKFIIGILFLGIAMAAACHLIYEQIYPLGENNFIPFTRGTNNNTWWASISAGPMSALKIIIAAVAIKLLKRWWLKQKENQQLEREKINAELQLLKAQIHPGFLFNTLNNIYVYALAESPRAPEMLLKLSDLLSYMLYECEGPLVPLEKEIHMMREYMALEKIRMAENLEMEILVKGDLHNKFIAPFLLLPFIENSFKLCNTMPEKCWISLEMKMEENNYLVKLINGIPPDLITPPDLLGNGLTNVQKRLNLLYPGKHELKMNVDQEMFLVNLIIQLQAPPSSPAGGKYGIPYREAEDEQAITYAQH